MLGHSAGRTCSTTCSSASSGRTRPGCTRRSRCARSAGSSWRVASSRRHGRATPASPVPAGVARAGPASLVPAGVAPAGPTARQVLPNVHPRSHKSVPDVSPHRDRPAQPPTTRSRRHPARSSRTIQASSVPSGCAERRAACVAGRARPTRADIRLPRRTSRRIRGRRASRRIRGRGAGAAFRGRGAGAAFRGQRPRVSPQRGREAQTRALVIAQRAALRGHRRPARRPRSAEGVPYPCFSRCPPKPKRMAESTWSAKSASPRELKRS